MIISHRLPPEANPLDPQFADPALFARGRERGGGGMGGMGRVLRGELGGDRGWEGQGQGEGDEQRGVFMAELAADLFLAGGDPAEILQNIRNELNFLSEDDIRWVIEEVRQLRASGMRVEDGNLDPNLPLMQLFLQTFLPWNNVRNN